jgi:hypothetical protein
VQGDCYVDFGGDRGPNPRRGLVSWTEVALCHAGLRRVRWAPKIGERVFVFSKVPLPFVDKTLKRRIARVLSCQAARKLDLRRNALLGLAGVLALGGPMTVGVVRGTMPTVQAAAQAPPATSQGRGRGRRAYPVATICGSC